MKKLDTIESIVVDSTSTAWIRTKENAEPSKDAINEAIGPRHKVNTLKRVERVIPKARYEVHLDGMS